MTNGLSKDSCLLGDMSGSSRATGRGLSVDEAQAGVVRLDTMAMEAHEAVTGVAAPAIYRTYQARAATARARSKADIDTIVLHTPEGGESGTLSVLNGTGAGFDWFLPPSGRLYKCNDYYRYIAWQAGDWPTNQRSIGIEQWDFAASMHNAPAAHYDRLARLCAYLVTTLELSVRHATSYGGHGFIYHRTVTPGARCDPDACTRSRFDIARLMDLTLDYARGSGPTPPTPEPVKKVYRVRVNAGQAGAFYERKNAEERVAALKKLQVPGVRIEEGPA